MSQLQKTILREIFEKVFYAGPKFSAGRLRDADGRSRSFAGKLFAVEGQFDCGLRNGDCGLKANGKMINSAIGNWHSVTAWLSAFGLTHHVSDRALETGGA